MMKTKKTRKTQKTQTNNETYMSDNAFADLKKGMKDALAFERGKRRDLKVTRIQAPTSAKDKVV